MTDELATATGLVTVTVTPVALPENFSIPEAISLARDLALNMYELPVILKKHGISDTQYATLKTNTYFAKLVEQMALDWNGSKSAQERLALQAAVGLETVLPEAIARVKNKNELLTGVSQMVKVLADIAGANNHNKAPSAPSEKFTITINLGADREVYDKSKPIIDLQPAPAGEVPAVPEGFSSLLTLQTEPEKP